MSTSVPSYKLIYFDLRVLGEPIRQIFEYLHLPFEDVRVALGDWGKEAKKNYKFHQLPELHVGGSEPFVLTQSTAICRYLANTYTEKRLMPRSALEIAKCDEVVGIVEDMRLRAKAYVLAKHFSDTTGSQELLEMKKRLCEEEGFLHFLNNLEGMVGEGGGPFILGANPTWADFFLSNFTSIWEGLLDDQLLKDCPNLKAQKEAVESIPEIRNWIKKRKKSEL